MAILLTFQIYPKDLNSIYTKNTPLLIYPGINTEMTQKFVIVTFACDYKFFKIIIFLFNKILKVNVNRRKKNLILKKRSKATKPFRR